MENVKIFVVQQGAVSYENTDVLTFVFLNEADARAKYEYLRKNREVGCSPYDRTWESIHAVNPGDQVDTDNEIA